MRRVTISQKLESSDKTASFVQIEPASENKFYSKTGSSFNKAYLHK
jgi:hypothetical protein